MESWPMGSRDPSVLPGHHSPSVSAVGKPIEVQKRSHIPPSRRWTGCTSYMNELENLFKPTSSSTTLQKTNTWSSTEYLPLEEGLPCKGQGLALGREVL